MSDWRELWRCRVDDNITDVNAEYCAKCGKSYKVTGYVTLYRHIPCGTIVPKNASVCPVCGTS